MLISTLSRFAFLSLPDPEAIRGKAAEVVARPEFQLDSSVNPETLGLWVRILRWILTPIQWLLSFLDGLPHPLRWLVVIGLIVVLVALMVHIVWSFVSAITDRPRYTFTSASSENRTTAEDLELKAEQAEAQGDYIGAVRLLFRASLLRIERAEEKPIRRGITNWELLRRYRTSPLFGPLEWFVQTIDSKWYGHDECVRDDCVNCRTEYARIRGLVERQAHAIRA